jgi:solute carrier family 25 iron transporter 28/37
MVEIDEDWEEWSPEKGSFLNHAVAGSLAGVAEHTFMYPVDTIKTHLQCRRCGVAQEGGAFDAARQLVKEGGTFRLWRGVSTMFTACIPAHAAYFSIFEAAKSAMGGDKKELNEGAIAAAGAMSTFAHDFITTPLDLVKQRLQLGHHGNLMSCMGDVIREEGVRSLYRSLPVTLLMNLPYGMVMVSTNESLKRVLNPSNEQNLGAFLLAGLGSGAVAGFVTNPLDVVKTRLQTAGMIPEPGAGSINSSYIPPQMSKPCMNTGSVVMGPGSGAIPFTPTPTAAAAAAGGSSSSSAAAATSAAGAAGPAVAVARVQGLGQGGLVSTVKTIMAEDGLRGFFRGVGARVSLQAPSVAISWATYETVKRMIGNGAEGQ